MPETVMLELGWPLSEKAQADIDDKKRKPSKEIRIDAMRDAVEFAQRTAGRGRGKAMLVYPAERMNHITANALLKTLEEPPGDLKFVLASEAAHQLLPTIRSRCLTHTLTWPQEAESLTWMAEQGVKKADAEPLLRAAGGRPADALNFANSGRNPSDWQSFPKAMAKGDVGFVANWLPADLLDAQQKLCHDLMASKSGATPRFFKPADLPTAIPSYTALAAWHKTLSATARTVEHPFNAGLMLEALVSGAQRAMLTNAKR
jgi:DNA polymerase-3 subunit delta'